jgi:hypothetical protein
MSYFRKNSKFDSFFCKKIKNKTPNYRYSDPIDPPIENPDENSEFFTLFAPLKPWLLDKLRLQMFEVICQRLFPSLTGHGKEQCIQDLLDLSKRPVNDEEIFQVILKYRPWIQLFSLHQDLTEDPEKSSKNEKVEKNNDEYLKLINLNERRNTKTGDDLVKIQKNLDIKLEPVRIPRQPFKDSKKTKISEIFEFFALDYHRKKRLKSTIDKKSCNTISLEYFLHFCKCFNFYSLPNLNEEVLSGVFKRNSLYHKVMKVEHFIDSLADISKLAFYGSVKADQLFTFMGLESEDFRRKLSEKNGNLNFSRSEKTLNQTINKHVSRKSETTKQPERPARLGNGKMPKTSCHKTRTPITWKYLNEADISELGEEFDVRKEIFPRLMIEKKINSIY